MGFVIPGRNGELSMKKWTVIVVFVLGLLLSACGAETSAPAAANPTPAVQALQTYLQALVDKDEDTLVRLTCADWELKALLEFDAFGGVETSLDGLSCEQVSSGDGSATVVCQGKILASYQNEVQEFDLGSRNYQMVEQSGDWLVCGF
jgi:hypothetical protein